MLLCRLAVHQSQKGPPTPPTNTSRSAQVEEDRVLRLTASDLDVAIQKTGSAEEQLLHEEEVGGSAPSTATEVV